MKSIVLISLGALNFLHGMMHIIQFVQSILLVTYASNHKEEHHEGVIDTILHHPAVAVLWAVIGLATLIIGIKDYRHHKKCKPHKH